MSAFGRKNGVGGMAAGARPSFGVARPMKGGIAKPEPMPAGGEQFPPLPGGGKLKDVAGEVLNIARAGLTSRGRLNGSGDNETGFLAPLDEIVESGIVPAQRLLDLYHGEWNGDISRVYEESF